MRCGPGCSASGVGSVDPSRRGLLLVTVSALSFGGVAVLTKLALGAGMSVVDLQFWRWGLAFLALGPLVLARGLGPRKHALAAFGVGFVGQGLASGTYAASLQHLDAALGAFLLYLNPVFVAVLAASLLGERLTRRGLLALGVAVAGLGLMAFAPGVAASPLGVGLALFAAVAYAGVIVAGRRLTGQAPPLRVAAYLMLGATCAFGLGSALTGTLALPPEAAWGHVVLLAVVCTALSVGTFYLALPLIGAPKAALVSTLEPVSTVLVAYLVLGELFTPLQFAGGGLILLAVALLALEAPVEHGLEGPEAQV
jgi:drug/metabolite transporter (DMT)-like permease